MVKDSSDRHCVFRKYHENQYLETSKKKIYLNKLLKDNWMNRQLFLWGSWSDCLK